MEKEGMGVGIGRTGSEMSYLKSGSRAAVARAWQSAVPIGRGVYVGLCPAFTCPEHHTVYEFHRRHQNALPGFFAVDKDLHQPTFHRSFYSEMQCLSGSIFAHAAIACASFAANLSLVG